ncbi:site-specific integrase [Variovorax sp. KBW07]|uniref:tyrosine-type recombinase/integrase n=1 Tax=Variovorax sp. KBW07 TaxID=2153358 RepID=UPI000F578680|nr:tyrosine-type recombinase/integrase [Variovorax sp. KBW07]RQO57062.1 site-specific integrase [Variovorax sp. KBW07]
MNDGITVLKRTRKEVIRIAFSFKGVQCREILDLPGTRPNLLYAERLRGEILRKIEQNSFRYNEYFPQSPKCKIFGHGTGVTSTTTIKELLESYRDRAKASLQPSTWTGYRKAIDNVLVPQFGGLTVPALSVSILREWIATKKVTRKRMSNLLLPLRNALSEALADEVIAFNPLDRLKLEKVLPRETLSTDYAPNPYTLEELVPALVSMDGTERAAFQLWAFTGLRTSELIALSWRDVDLVAWTIYVHTAVVEGEEKGTKTKAGIRTIPLLPAAQQALEDERQRTEKADGRVFLNPRTGKEWTDQSLLRLWKRTCTKSKTIYRNPYQMRHTFASQLLSQGENPAYIAKLLGHKTTEMVTRHYGRWVEQGVALGFDRPASRYGQELLLGLPPPPEKATARVKNE